MHKKYSFSSHLTTHFALGTLAVLASANIVSAQMLTSTSNIVQNPGFETGDFTGWTQGGNTSESSVGGTNADQGTMPNSGSFEALFENTEVTGAVSGTLIQTLATSPNTYYDLSFYVASDVGPTTFVVQPFDLTLPMEFQASFNGSVVYDTASSGDPSQFYDQITVNGLLATSTATTLEFDFSTDNPVYSYAYYELDDVAVTAAVPEPPAWAMMLAGTGLFGAAVVVRRSRPSPFLPAGDVSLQTHVASFAM